MTEATFGDNVRIRSAPETEALKIARAFGSVSGSTTPSVTNVEVIGTLHDDYALAVTVQAAGETYWLPLELVEFIDHAAGAEMWVAGSRFKSVRAETGEWVDVPLTQVELETKGLPAVVVRHGRDRRSLVSLLLVLAAWLVVATLGVRESLAADACLDSGGSFNYLSMRCDKTQSHPVVPFAVRHPYVVGLAGMLTILLPVIRLLRRASPTPGRRG